MDANLEAKLEGQCEAAKGVSRTAPWAKTPGLVAVGALRMACLGMDHVSMMYFNELRDSRSSGCPDERMENGAYRSIARAEFRNRGVCRANGFQPR